MQTAEETKRTMSKKHITIGSKYILGPKIGSGEFGETYVVAQTQTQQLFALKRQDQKSKNSTLLLQIRVLKLLEHNVGFPQLKWSGTQNKFYTFVTEMLGPSLQDLFAICGSKFTLKTTIMVIDQMIQRIQQLHSKNYVHRDIRPSNFLMGVNKKSHIVHLIDFGLAKKYRDVKTRQHVPYKQNKNLIGTMRYASINVHLGIDHSRRDDLQSISYILVYFLQGCLPWQGIKANSKNEKYQKIMQKKMSFAIDVECGNYPWQVTTFINYCQGLKYDQKPNYYFLRKMLRDLLQNQGYKFDYCYDWIIYPNNKKLQNGKIKIEFKGSKTIATKIFNQNILQPLSINKQVNHKVQFQLIKQQTIVKIPQASHQQSLFYEQGEQNVDELGMQDEGIEDKDEKVERGLDLQDKKNKLYDNDIQLDE